MTEETPAAAPRKPGHSPKSQPSIPPPTPETKAETMSGTPTAPDSTTRAGGYAARLRATTADSSEFTKAISEAKAEAIKASPTNLRDTNTTSQISFADGSALSLAPGKGGITTWRVSAPATPAPGKKRKPQVGDIYVLSNGSVAYIAKLYDGGGENGYRSYKFALPGSPNQVNIFSQGVPLDITRTSVLISEEEFKAKFPWLVEHLEYRLAHPAEDIEARLTVEANEAAHQADKQVYEAFVQSLNEMPEYLAEVKQVTALAPEWLTANGKVFSADSDYFAAVEEEKFFAKKVKKAEAALEKAQDDHQLTKEEREEAKKTADAAKKEHNRLSLNLGQSWFRIKALADPTGQWTAWLTTEAQNVCPDINKEQVLEQLKMYENWHLLVPQEELRNAIIERGIKPTKKTIETAKEVLAEMAVEAAKAAPEAAKADESVPSASAPDETTGAKPPAVATPPQQPLSEEGKKRMSEVFAQKVEQRTKSKITAIRSEAGQLGGAGNKAPATPATPPQPAAPQAQPVHDTAEEWVRTTYTAVAEAVSHVAKDDATDRLIDLIGRILGCGMGIQNAVTICPSGPLYGFARFTFATNAAKLAETAKEHFSEQRKPVGKETLDQKEESEAS